MELMDQVLILAGKTEHIIDGVIFPSLRDKLILLRGKYLIRATQRKAFRA
jgi:hypothetical protein